MGRRSFIAGCLGCAALSVGRRGLGQVHAATTSAEQGIEGPLLEVEAMEDRDGPSLLVTTRDLRRRPLVVVSHCLGRAPWDQLSARSYDKVLAPLAQAGHALLLSYDAGTETYGNDEALAYNRRVTERAVEAFDWDGRVYTLGISMGGLPALLAAYSGSLGRPVEAVGLIAGVADLAAVHRYPSERRQRIEEAYGAGGTGLSFERASEGHDPLGDFERFAGRDTPVLCVASLDDTVVPRSAHAEPLVALSRKTGAASKLVDARGPHIGPGHFTQGIADAVIEFFREAPSPS